MSEQDELTATLIISHWSSSCSRCHGNADPDEDRHIHGGPGSMYARGSDLGSTNGCGARYTAKEKDYLD